MEKISYSSEIGSIMYGMLCIRPNVTLALSVMRRFQPNPGERHCEAVKCILKYLKRTKDVFLVYGREKFKLHGYSESSFYLNPNDSISTYGFLFTLNKGEVSWKSSK